jgi:hypothetical protein
VDGNIDDMITLDPAVVYEYSGILVTHNVYQTLVTFVGSDLQTIKPGLAIAGTPRTLAIRGS